MNRIEEMIRELCPNGVEYKALHYCPKKFSQT